MKVVYHFSLRQRWENGAYEARSSHLPYYVRVAGYGVQNFVEKARDYFLPAPPRPRLRQRRPVAITQTSQVPGQEDWHDLRGLFTTAAE
jgi:hypothetical protein